MSAGHCLRRINSSSRSSFLSVFSAAGIYTLCSSFYLYAASPAMSAGHCLRRINSSFILSIDVFCSRYLHLCFCFYLYAASTAMSAGHCLRRINSSFHSFSPSVSSTAGVCTLCSCCYLYADHLACLGGSVCESADLRCALPVWPLAIRSRRSGV